MKYNLIYIYTIDDAAHKGLVKVGKASLDSEDSEKSPNYFKDNCEELNIAAKKRINGETVTAGVAYELRHTELAIRYKHFEDGAELMDHFVDDDVKKVLKASGIKVVCPNGVASQEWYETNLPTAINAIKATKEGRSVLTPAEIVPDDPSQKVEIKLHEEQEDAVRFTIERIGKRKKKILWNAKMRFGKTLAALALVQRRGFKRTIIVTHRPVVGSGWQEDFYKLFGNSREYTFFKKETTGDSDEGVIDAKNERQLKKLVREDKKFIYFASVQDLRGSKRVGGSFDKNNAVFDIEWDLIINDEAHEGTQTQLGQDVFLELLKNPQTGKQSKKTVLLSLSGTPFNILDQYDDNVYTWDYVMEQQRKATWGTTHPGEPNPYADMPKMHIYTYSLSQLIPGYVRDDLEGKSFNFYEFFRTWTGNPRQDGRPLPQGAKVGDFVHASDVRSFLDLIVRSDDSKYPFSTQEYRDLFKHTLWMLPGVKEARALSAMLKAHPVFGAFEIANVAGDGDAEEPYDDALEKVNQAIKESPYTITLSCGKLTTGVTVKEWTAVLMLSGTASTSAAGYLQTIFRVQSAGKIDGRQKTDCYVFDFAPDRTLRVLTDAINVTDRNSRGSDNAERNRQKLQEFLNYCPVIAIQGTKMEPYSVNAMMEEIKHIFVSKAIRNGFDDYAVYNDRLLDLSSEEWDVLNGIKATLEKTRSQPGQTSIDVNAEGFANPPETPPAPPTEPTEPTEPQRPGDPEAEERKRRKKERKEAIAILRAVSIRMPLLIYGADVPLDDDITIEKFAELVDDSSWSEFMPDGITKEKFAEIIKFYDRDVFIAAGRQIRRLAKAADTMIPTERVKKIAEIFTYFKNPDKETVLTPWRVVNMHMSDTLGGWCFYNEKFEEDINNEHQYIVNRLPNPRFVDRGKVTREVLSNPNARVLEINSKSGLYPLYVTYSFYRAKLGDTPESELSPEELLKLWDDAVAENIFVVCNTPMARSITKRTLRGYRTAPVNACCFDGLVDRLKNDKEAVAAEILRGATWKRDEETMKFDAVVGNPPYHQESLGVASQSVYPYFIEEAIDLGVNIISMITPSRWMTATSGPLVDYRHHLFENNHFKEIVDFQDATLCFTTVELKGGASYFLYDARYTGLCKFTSVNAFGERETSMRPLHLDEIDIIIRSEKIASILRKVLLTKEVSFSTLVSCNDPFGFDIRENHSSRRVKPIYSLKKKQNQIPFYYNGWRKDGIGYVNKKSVRKGEELISAIKIFIPKAWGTGNISKDWLNSFIPEPNAVCTETYLAVGPFNNLSEAKNALSYMQTRFFHTMVSAVKSTQNTMQKAYTYVPLQDFSKPWTDEELYAKYGLSEDEIAFIESKVAPMDGTQPA